MLCFLFFRVLFQSYFSISLFLFLYFIYFLVIASNFGFLVILFTSSSCFSLPLLLTHNFDFALCGPSRFGYDTTTTTTSGSQFRYYVACDEWYTELLEQTLHGVPTTNNGTQLYQ